jgi:hypothetical protein
MSEREFAISHMCCGRVIDRRDATDAGKIALFAAVAMVVTVMTVWFRGHGWRVDALLWVVVAVASSCWCSWC